jgi:peptidoglycan/LPS O-acetylase OafA/YrhL
LIATMPSFRAHLGAPSAADPYAPDRDRGSVATLSLFRFSLALMVMATHLGGALPLQLGRAAVEAFFCISGFLITMVANGRYAGRPLAFLANRFLRIYPTYWFCLLAGYLIVTAIPNGNHLHPSLYVPVTWSDIAANLAIFGLTQDTASRLLPAAWSLHTELWFYLVIGLITAGRARLTLVLLIVSSLVSAAAAARLIALPFYGTPLGNAYAFFIGSAVWHSRHVLNGVAASACFVVGLILFEGLAWLPGASSLAATVFLAAPAAGVLLWGLWNCPLDALLGRFSGVCAFLGRLAYPVFLLHWPVALVVLHLFGVWHNWAMFLGSAVFSIAGGILVVFLLEKPIEKWRAQIRRRPARLDHAGLPQISAQAGSVCQTSAA